MKYLTSALIIGLLISGPSLAQQSLVGAYKLVSWVQDEQGGEKIERYGKSPRGDLLVTRTQVAALYTGDVRKPGTSVAEKAALYDTLNSWSGRYRVDGSKMIISVSASSNENWTGTVVVWNTQLSGNSLTLTSDPRPSGRDPSKTVTTRMVLEKVE